MASGNGYMLAWHCSALIACGVLAGSGDWPEPRQNPSLTAVQPLGGRMLSAPRSKVTFDLGRRRPEIMPVALADGSGHVGLCQVGGALQCYDTQGRLLWKSHPPELNFDAIGAIRAAEDFDGDGQQEVLLKAGRPQYPYGAAVLLSLATGELLWRYDVEPMSYAWYAHVGHYLPATKAKQIVVIMHGYPPDKDNGYMVLFEYPAPGSTPQLKWRYDFHEYTCFPTFLQTDLDGDGVKELVVETHSRMWFLDARTGALKHFVGWDVAPANVRSYGHTRFLDLDRDGRDDFLCIADFAQHHEVLRNRGGKMEKAWHYGWAANVTTGKIVTSWPEPVEADVDGDGSLEIVLSMFNGEGDQAWLVRVYDAVTGKLKYRHPGMIAVRCVDVDGDGKAEILGNLSDDPMQKRLAGTELLAVADGRLQAVWQEGQAEALGMLPPRRERGKRIVTTAGAPVSQPPRVRRGGQIFTLNRDAQGKVGLHRWQIPEREPAADFSAVPAVKAAAMPTLLAADLTGDGVNELVACAVPDVRVLRLTGTALVPVGNYRSDATPVLADLDGDGLAELVSMTVDSAKPPVVEAIS